MDSSPATAPQGNPLPVGGVHHVSLRVDDLDEALGFYEGVLGLRRLPRPDLGFPGAWMQAGAVELHLLQTPLDGTNGTPPCRATPMANHFGMSVSDPELITRELELRGFQVHVHDAALPQRWVQDPSGNVVEFIAPRTSTA